MIAMGLYHKQFKNYDEMKKYYLMANNKDSLHLLGSYYKRIKDYENMKKYYLLSLSIKSMYSIAYYYESIKDYDEMKIYLIMLVERNERVAMINLHFHYKHVEKNYEEADKLCLILDSFKKKLIFNKLIYIKFYGYRRNIQFREIL